MPSIPVLSLDTAPENAKPMMQQVQDNFGFIPNLIGVMAHSPALTQAYLSVADIFSKSSLSTTEQQIVLLTVSHFHECRYCVAAHTVIAGMQKVDDAVVQAIRDDLPIADDKLQALRHFTQLLVENRGWLPDEDVQVFIDAGYTQQHVLDILVGIAQKTLSNYTNHLAGTPLDEAFNPAAWQPKSA